MVAARKGDMDTLKALLELGSPVDEVGQNGRTAFIHASIPMEFDTHKLMLKVGANIDASGNEGRRHCIMSCSVALLVDRPSAKRIYLPDTFDRYMLN